jgi:hypothetical protein
MQAIDLIVLSVVWLLGTIACFGMRAHSNKSIKFDCLKITWEPYALSGWWLVVLAASAAKAL